MLGLDQVSLSAKSCSLMQYVTLTLNFIINSALEQFVVAQWCRGWLCRLTACVRFGFEPTSQLWQFCLEFTFSPAPVWVSSGGSGVLSQPTLMQVGPTGYSLSLIGVNNSCLSPCFSPAINCPGCATPLARSQLG